MTSILFKQMENLIPELIDENQSGFIQGWQAQENIRHILHLINHAHETKLEMLSVSLDTERHLIVLVGRSCTKS